MADLEKMILAKRENNFNGFLNYMTNKYSNTNEDMDMDMAEEEEHKNKRTAKNKKKGQTSLKQ